MTDKVKKKMLYLLNTRALLTLAICEGRVASNLMLGILDENCRIVDLFLVTDRARRANLLIPGNI